MNSRSRIVRIPLFIFILLITISNITYAGGGWPQPKGKGYFKLSEWWVIADQHYTTNGMTDPNITSGLYNTTFYGEYGLTDRFTLIANIPLLSRSVINNQVSLVNGEVLFEGDAINAPGDIDLTLKYGFLNISGISISSSLTFGVPTGVTSGGNDGLLQTGDGELNQMLRIDAGIPLGGNESFSAYSNVYFGFNNRVKGFSDEYRYGAEAGIGVLGSKLWLTGRLDIIKSRMDQADGPIDGSFFANNAEVTSVTAEISYQFNHRLGVSVGYGTAIDGRIVYAAPSYTVGVFMKV